MKIITYVSVALGLVSAVASTATQIAQNGRTSSLERLLRLASRRKTKQASSFRSAAASQLDSSAVPKANSTVCGSDCESTLSFAGQAAAAHAVGSDIPGFPIPLKKSWAGSIPVGPTNPNATLFFWLWGAEEKKDTDDLVIWLNGGPGCSSLLGFMTENGPIRFDQNPPAKNLFSWTTAANIVWIEQPVGTGFSTGTPTALDETDVAEQFSGFLANFFKTFPELVGKKLWIAGESYAGMYIPFIANHMYTHGNPFNLQGVYIIDPVISDFTLQGDAPTYPFVVKNQKLLNLTDSEVAQIKAAADGCGLTNYVETNLLYPPKGPMVYDDAPCNGTYPEDVYLGLMDNMPCFDVYHITDTCDTYFVGNEGYFNNPELQDYIHAPHLNWEACGPIVFPHGDRSTPPDRHGILQRTIEKSQRAIIANGDLDGLIMTNGTALALQNLFWNGDQGFKTPPTNSLIGTDGKESGSWVTERGLTFAVHTTAGHMVPEYDPSGALKSLLFLLGRVPSLGA